MLLNNIKAGANIAEKSLTYTTMLSAIIWELFKTAAWVAMKESVSRWAGIINIEVDSNDADGGHTEPSSYAINTMDTHSRKYHVHIK